MSYLKRLERVCNRLESQIPGFSARLNYRCCSICGHTAMEGNGCDNYIFTTHETMDDCFERVWQTHVDGRQELVGHLRNLTQGISGVTFQHHFTDKSLKGLIVAAFNNEEFLVEWKDWDDRVTIRIHP